MTAIATKYGLCMELLNKHTSNIWITQSKENINRKLCINNNQRVEEFMSYSDFIREFSPYVIISFPSVPNAWEWLQDYFLSSELDTWTYSWNSEKYSSIRAYKCLKVGPIAPAIYQQIWKSSVILRYKIGYFSKDRVNTKILLSRKSFSLSDYNCVLCQFNTEETVLRLFLDCPFSVGRLVHQTRREVYLLLMNVVLPGMHCRGILL